MERAITRSLLQSSLSIEQRAATLDQSEPSSSLSIEGRTSPHYPSRYPWFVRPVRHRRYSLPDEYEPSRAEQPSSLPVCPVTAAEPDPVRPYHLRLKVVPHDVIEIDEDDDQDGVVIIGESLSNNKNILMKYGNDSKNAVKKPILIIEDDIDVKHQAFKQFDTVRDYSDHHFNRREILKITPTGKEPAKDWAKRIQHEWKVLEKDLPETIFVRIYEARMDILRAVIIGPAGTPYHDGLFFFDIYFPPTFPLVPPMVHYHSGGLRLNPNLYECGKVCLSLLNTWPGQGCETWNSSNSTVLQILVSIQALVLNAKPYFNEPGFAPAVNTPHGMKESLAYNEKTFILSCKTMLYSLRNPPKHFEEFVAEHFRSKGRAILVACRAYIRGAQVGCVVGNGVQDVDEGNTSSSSEFKENLRALYDQLVMEFAAKGADTDKL